MVVDSGSAGTQGHWGPDLGASAVFQFMLLIPESAELVAPLGHTMGIVIKFDHQSLYNRHSAGVISRPPSVRGSAHYDDPSVCGQCENYLSLTICRIGIGHAENFLNGESRD